MKPALIFLVLFLFSCSTPKVLGGEGTPRWDQICEKTGGVLEKVSKQDYPPAWEQGIFDIDNHPDYTYRCTCPEELVWSLDGCA